MKMGILCGVFLLALGGTAGAKTLVDAPISFGASMMRLAGVLSVLAIPALILLRYHRRAKEQAAKEKAAKEKAAKEKGDQAKPE